MCSEEGEQRMQQPPTPPQPVDVLAYVYVFCRVRTLKQILEEWHDLYEAERKAVIPLYGHTGKARQGFIIVAWMTPIPSTFLYKLQTDPDFLDFVRFDRPSTLLPLAPRE